MLHLNWGSGVAEYVRLDEIVHMLRANNVFIFWSERVEAMYSRYTHGSRPPEIHPHASIANAKTRSSALLIYDHNTARSPLPQHCSDPWALKKPHSGSWHAGWSMPAWSEFIDGGIKGSALVEVNGRGDIDHCS